jgi:hypothetical protein
MSHLPASCAAASCSCSASAAAPACLTRCSRCAAAPLALPMSSRSNWASACSVVTNLRSMVQQHYQTCLQAAAVPKRDTAACIAQETSQPPSTCRSAALQSASRSRQRSAARVPAARARAASSRCRSARASAASVLRCSLRAMQSCSMSAYADNVSHCCCLSR